MRFRELHRYKDSNPSSDSSPGSPSGDRLAGLRREGEAFLKAGDEAIDRALSGNSEAFLSANRQLGGE